MNSLLISQLKRWTGVLFSVFAILLLSGVVPIDIISIGGTGILTASGYLARLSADPQLWKKWDAQVLKQGEIKTEFSESEIGTTWGDDGPEKSDRVTSSPIVQKTDFKDGGKYMDVPFDNPLFTEADDILNAGRYGEQDRIGAEETLTRDNFRLAVDKWHLGIAEKEVEESVPQTANMTPGKFMQKMVDRWSDNYSQKKDYGTFFSAFAGHDIHHFIAAGERASLSHGDRPVGSPNMGIMDRPFELRRAYAYIQDGNDRKLQRITYNADTDTYENNIVTEISKITDDTKPGLDLFRKINRICLRTGMIPCRIADPDGKSRDYFLVMIPGGARDLAEKDTEFKDVMNSAYQKMVDKHPLLRTGDVLYKNLVIRDSTKLDLEYFSAKHSFNAISTALTNTTEMTFNRATVSSVEKLSISPGIRQFGLYSDAASAFGRTKTDVIGRALVMGSAAIARAMGAPFDLLKLEVTQYGLKDGIGKTIRYGQARNEKWTTAGAFDSSPQLFQIFMLADEDAA